MRNIFRQMFGILICLAFILPSCKKDAPNQSAPTSPSQKHIKNQLLSFKEKLGQKSSEIISLDSAVWYVEALINFEDANNQHDRTNFIKIEDSIKIDCSRGNVSVTNLASVYSNFNTIIDNFKSSVTDTSFKIEIVDISLNRTTEASGNVTMKMVVLGGFKLIGNYIAFGSEDYWKWGDQMGKCNGLYQGQLGASDVLESKFNHPIVATEPGSFTDVDLINQYGTHYPDSPNNPGPYCQSMIFMETHNSPAPSGWQQPCLGPDELNYYLSKFDYIKLDNKPTNKTFDKVDVWNDYMYPNGYTALYHVYGLYYGIFQPKNEN